MVAAFNRQLHAEHRTLKHTFVLDVAGYSVWLFLVWVEIYDADPSISDFLS